MPLFSKVFKSKDGAAAKAKNKSQPEHTNGHTVVPARPKYVSTWSSKEIDPEEIQELVRACTLELKSRAEALDAPFLLLPFRPEADTGPAKTFIRNFYRANKEGSLQYTSTGLRRELTLTEPAVLCSIMKWCWSRMPGGVVSWSVYEMFRLGEQDSNMARNAFNTFLPLSVDSTARMNIIVDFYDLLAAIAAHGKTNGLGGRKLSRMSGWWAFEHSDEGKGFEGGYTSWARAADASSHLFFAYLRSLKPKSLDGFTGINALPRSLQALVAQSEYPPETPSLMQKRTPKVVMLVDSVSPGPFALLRRATRFEYRDEDLQVFSEYSNPVQALTEECKRVLDCITSANQSTAQRSQSGMNLAIEGLGSKPDESWARFQDFGFSGFNEAEPTPDNRHSEGISRVPRSRQTKGARPTTPSWADFLNSGFADESDRQPPPAATLLPPDKILPPLGDDISRTGTRAGEDDLDPGELASITYIDLDDTFWWVWITSLANEEPTDRKAVFGRCVLFETGILGGRWLVMEEQVKGASPEPVGAYFAEKKSRFGFSRRGKAGRRRSGVPTKTPEPAELDSKVSPATPSKVNLSTDQQAKIKAAAAVLVQQRREQDSDSPGHRRARYDDATSTKTNSIMTLGLTNEAGPAMKWASAFDKEAIRKQYLGDNFAGTGASREVLVPDASSVNRTEASQPAPIATAQLPSTSAPERDLPPLPPQQVEEPTPKPEPVADAPVPETPATKAPVDAVKPVSDTVATEAAKVPLPEVSPRHETATDALSSNQNSTATTGTTMSPKIVNVGRKPVPKPVQRTNNIQQHPAFRKLKELSGEAKAPEQSPAERAAREAWEAKAATYSPDIMAHQKRDVQKQPDQQSGFKKFFGKKKDDPKRRSFQQSPSVASLQPPSDSNFGRKRSLLRKKSPTQKPPSESSMSAAQPVQSRVAEPPTPTASDYAGTDRNASVSAVDTEDRRDAEQAFSRFDQGPLTDAPAFVPRDSEDSFERPVSHRAQVEQDYMTAPSHGPGGFPDTPAEFVTPMESARTNDAISEASVDLSHQEQAPSYDRWAQIRKNAAERAARMSEDQQSNSRPAQSILTERTEDDGDTSGEETIEHRVARIKARVAELTGKLDIPPPNYVQGQ
ncbi:hypothetical protein MBLNU459_g2184t1 [Dothideomycetes sp. NU459]